MIEGTELLLNQELVAGGWQGKIIFYLGFRFRFINNYLGPKIRESDHEYNFDYYIYL